MIRRLLAPNPGPYTGPGTNTYLVVDRGEALILDPGPVIAPHRLEILAALRDLQPVGVVATHTHPDHAPLSNPLADELKVPVYGHSAGPSFLPDVRLVDGGTVPVGGTELVAVHTPGHTADHLCFVLGDVLFTGDHIMGGSTVVIDDAAAYMESLYRVGELAVRRIEPGHGPAMDDAGSVIREYIDHRLMRERQLLEAIAAGAATVADLVEAVYGDVPPEVLPAAAHQVVVQLEKLAGEGRVQLLPGGTSAETTVELTR